MSTIFKVHTLYTLAWFMHNSIQLSINMAWAPAWLYMGKHVLPMPCQIALYDHGCLTLILDNTVQFFIYCVYERLCACKIVNAKKFRSHPCKPYPYASVHICAHASGHEKILSQKLPPNHFLPKKSYPKTPIADQLLSL